VNDNKINFYYDKCIKLNDLTNSLKELNSIKNSVDNAEFEIIKGKINGFYVQKPKSSWEWFEENGLPDMKWICKDLGICPGPITILSSYINSGKTLFADDLAISVANGIPLFGEIPIQESGKVVHIDFEAGELLSKIYYWRLLNGHGLKSFNNINYIKPEWKLDQQEAKDNLLNILKGAKLCIIDCLSAGIPNTNQNEESARAPIDMLNDVSEKTGCAIVLLHHEPKQTDKNDPLRSVKGSGAIIAACSNSLHIKRDFGSSIATISRGKTRFGRPFSVSYEKEDVGPYSEKIADTIGVRFKKVNSEEEIVNSNLDRKLLQMINDNPEIITQKLKDAFNVATSEIVNLINYLEREQLIKIEGQKPKKHSITDLGKEWLESEWNK
jgi:predicted transcriptional regulator